MSTEPVIVEQRATASEVVLLLSVPTDLEYFAGHFPGSPIVPGVVQLKWALEAARRLLAVAGDVARIEALKFQRAMTPGLAVTLTLRSVAADGKLYFAYESAGERFSSGRFVLRSNT